MIVDSTIRVHANELTPDQRRKLLRTLTFLDNDDVEVQAYDYAPDRGVLTVARGVWSLLPSSLEVTDRRVLPKLPKLSYARTLDAPGYDGQVDAVRAMFEHEQGQVIAPPGRGKTEIVLAFAAAAKTRTLVVVHTGVLFKQWTERIEAAIPGCAPGKIRGNNCQVEQITVAMAQTLRRYIGDKEFWKQWGCLVIDEAHHAAADTWSWLCNSCPAFYRFGVTASEKRSDGRQALVKFNVGPVIYKLKFTSKVPLIVRPIKTQFKTKYNGSQYTQIIRELVNDQDRNALIARIVDREVRRGNTVLVLSRQIKHLHLIYDKLSANYDGQVEVVTGQLPRRDQERLTADLREGRLSCILGTQLFEEGADIPRLNRIVLAFPGTEITALQKVGRGTRQFEGKTETYVYDMLDDKVRVLAKQYLRRKTWYRSVGITIKHKGKGKEHANETTHVPQGKGRIHRVVQVARSRRTG